MRASEYSLGVNSAEALKNIAVGSKVTIKLGRTKQKAQLTRLGFCFLAFVYQPVTLFHQYEPIMQPGSEDQQQGAKPLVGRAVRPLRLVAIDGCGGHWTVQWRIMREHDDAKPSLELIDSTDDDFLKEAYFLIPARRALEKTFQSE